DVPTYFSAKRGWFVNLPTTGERVVADAQIRGGRAIFASAIPPAGCDAEGSGWILEFDVYTGNRFDSSVFDIDNNGILNDADYLVGRTLTGWKTAGVPSAPIFVRFPAGDGVEKRYVGGDNDPEGPGGPPPAESRLRTMWRVVQ
ncbi:MAG: pilus assembly protein PilY, partial [Burkholderiaceae bacterium]|nr:pilus assembly protein PilY [Burkholderiaceae bacterium]